MPEQFIDSSVAVKWILDEVDSSIARSKSAHRQSLGDSFLLLDLAVSEVGNSIASRLHRKLIDEPAARDAWQRFQRAPVTVLSALPLLDAAFDLSVKYRIAVYDAAFIAAMLQRPCEAVTSDVPLYRAVKADVPALRLLKDW